VLLMSLPISHHLLREHVRKLERILGLLNDGEMSCCGITMAQCHALVEIGRARAISLNALATLLNLDNSTASRTVQNLVSAGLARRGPDPQDRRAVVIELAPEGEALFRKVEFGMTDQFETVWSRIPADKRDQVVESLRLLIDAMDEPTNAS
jgi:DNA-binding MarR family transcriptional regulator